MVARNVERSEWHNFVIPQPTEIKALENDIPYDYFSIMHYGKALFAKKDGYVSTKFARASDEQW